jgi:hypothetical protein
MDIQTRAYLPRIAGLALAGASFLGVTAAQAGERFGYSPATIRQMAAELRAGRLELFVSSKPGPKGPRKQAAVRDRVLELRAADRSITEIAVALWQRHLRHNPANPRWPDRDRFVVSPLGMIAPKSAGRREHLSSELALEYLVHGSCYLDANDVIRRVHPAVASDARAWNFHAQC